MDPIEAGPSCAAISPNLDHHRSWTASQIGRHHALSRTTWTWICTNSSSGPFHARDGLQPPPRLRAGYPRSPASHSAAWTPCRNDREWQQRVPSAVGDWWVADWIKGVISGGALARARRANRHPAFCLPRYTVCRAARTPSTARGPTPRNQVAPLTSSPPRLPRPSTGQRVLSRSTRGR